MSNIAIVPEGNLPGFNIEDQRVEQRAIVDRRINRIAFISFGGCPDWFDRCWPKCRNTVFVLCSWGVSVALIAGAVQTSDTLDKTLLAIGGLIFCILPFVACLVPSIRRECVS